MSQGVPIMLTIPKEIRNKLREISAKENLKNPDKVTSAAQIGREIIINFFKKDSMNYSSIKDMNNVNSNLQGQTCWI